MYSNVSASLITLFFAFYLAIAAPVPDTTNQVDNAYSGIGGHAVGGSVTHNTISGTRLLGGVPSMLKLFSGNFFLFPVTALNKLILLRDR